jgi:hypothetical protein
LMGISIIILFVLIILLIKRKSVDIFFGHIS